MMSFENFDNFMNKLMDKFDLAEDFYNKIDAALGNCACEPIIEQLSITSYRAMRFSSKKAFLSSRLSGQPHSQSADMTFQNLFCG